MYKFPYNSIKRKYCKISRLLLLILTVWCMKLKLKMSMKTLVKINTFLILVIIKMREETKGIAIEKKNCWIKDVFIHGRR